MNLLSLLIGALVPVIALFVFIYVKDRHQKEPAGKLFKALGFGVLSIIPVLIVVPIVNLIVAQFNEDIILAPMYQAFVSASIPEEASKLLMLWLVLRNNKYFDEKFDGIVYGACVALGFAGLENIMYISQFQDIFATATIMRGLLAVPMHFLCGVVMGYYYSLAKFYEHNRFRNMFLTFFVPMLAHGLYDYLLFSIPQNNVVLYTVLYAAAIYLSFRLWKLGLRYIREHVERDAQDMAEAAAAAEVVDNADSVEKGDNEN